MCTRARHVHRVGGNRLGDPPAYNTSTTVIPGGGQIIGKALSKRVDEWVTEAISQASKAFGASGDAFGVAKGWG